EFGDDMAVLFRLEEAALGDQGEPGKFSIGPDQKRMTARLVPVRVQARVVEHAVVPNGTLLDRGVLAEVQAHKVRDRRHRVDRRSRGTPALTRGRPLEG